MTIIELKQGILAQDWGTIVQYYEELTGEKVGKPPKKVRGRKAVGEKTQITVVPSTPLEVPAPVSPSLPGENGRRPSVATNVPIGLPNTWKDDKKIGRTDRLLDQKLLNGVSPSERRDAAILYPVTCVGCSRRFDVPASELPKNLGTADTKQDYRCPKCISRPRPQMG